MSMISTAFSDGRPDVRLNGESMTYTDVSPLTLGPESEQIRKHFTA